MAGRRNQMITKIVTFLIPHHPDCEIGVNIVEPGLKSIRIIRMSKQSGRYNSAAGRIMPTINTVGIRHAAGNISIPGKVCEILPERSAEPNIVRGIHPWV